MLRQILSLALIFLGLTCSIALTGSIALTCSIASAETPSITYKKLHLTEKFHCEGAFHADFNRDGNLDIVSGPYWYAGPDFKQRHEVRAPQEFNPLGYSDNFLTYTDDFNGDGWPDILYVPFPGNDAYWYANPGKTPPSGKPGHWKSHLALKNVCNESPVWSDVDGDGRKDLVFNIEGYLGYGTWDPARADKPWTFHRISPKGTFHRFTHGIGTGDINGDGRPDILEATAWWEQPAKPQSGKPQSDKPWTRHAFKFADAAAQMIVLDIDGDGLNDVVTAWHCHLFGLVWYQQTRNDKDEISFKQHAIFSPKPDLKSTDLRISQMHAMTAADFDGDGIKDILTGKRYWAHGPTGDIEADAPAVLYWFQPKRGPDGSVEFVPHKIDADSGVGTQVTAVDLNKDGTPDIIVGNKKGTYVFLSQKK